MRSNPKDVKKQLIDDLYSIEAQIVRKALAYRCHVKSAPANLLNHLTALSVTNLSSIQESLAHLSLTFDLAAQGDVNPWDDLKFLKLSMRSLNLTYASDFSNLIGDEDIVEGYDMNRRQIFRNLRFMEITNYSLIQLLSHDWPMLFHRAKEVNDILMKQAEQDLWTGNVTIKSVAPRHVTRELLCTPAQACEVFHKYFVPLYSGPNRPGGVLSVCEGKTLDIEVSVDPDRVAFL